MMKSSKILKEKKELLQKVRATEAMFRSVAESSLDALVVIGEDVRIREANPATVQMFGWKRKDLLGQSLELLVPKRPHPVHRKSLAKLIQQGSSDKFTKLYLFEGMHRNGTKFPVEIIISNFKAGRQRSYTVFIRNLAERRRLENALAEQAVRDSLTGLYNRRCYSDRIKEEISRADRNRISLSILLCDLDRFKAINDTAGHHVGDQLLKAVAKGIRESTRETDLVFRWGGDEFVAVLSDVTREGVLRASERIRREVHRIGGKKRLDLGVSIGVALYPEHGRDPDELIHLADQALYIAKKGKDKIHIGAEEYKLNDRSIKVVFQPVVDLRSHQVLGYEALSRDPQGKVSILELFEKYQAIGQLNELKCLCFRLQLKTAQQVGLKRVFLNLDFNVLSQLEPALKPDGMEVVLEISEVEALHDIENHVKITRKWREAGFKFALDDFGAGFISLPFLAKLIPDYIKMDRSTILQAVSSGKFKKFSEDLVRAIRNYSKEGIIAEGIETKEELQVVKEMGIDLAQGFLLGKPREINRQIAREI
jgi:diguanylate cyclase (GGDEF)-like protein/PAS domain S-box-containing protein